MVTSEQHPRLARIYRERAQRTRKLAMNVEDSEVSAMLSSAADDYEQLAREEEHKTDNPDDPASS